jgi:hypothetical protein
LRADDLLALRVEFVNLVLDNTQPQPRLVRSQDSFIIVHFAPQHIGEVDFAATGSPLTVLQTDSPAS